MIELKAEDCLRIERGPAVEIGCLHGVVWITQEGELQDMFLGPGEWRTLTPRGAMLITALEPSVLRVVDSAVAKSSAGGLLQRLWRWGWRVVRSAAQTRVTAVQRIGTSAG